MRLGMLLPSQAAHQVGAGAGCEAFYVPLGSRPLHMGLEDGKNYTSLWWSPFLGEIIRKCTAAHILCYVLYHDLYCRYVTRLPCLLNVCIPCTCKMGSGTWPSSGFLFKHRQISLRQIWNQTGKFSTNFSAPHPYHTHHPLRARGGTSPETSPGV